MNDTRRYSDLQFLLLYVMCLVFIRNVKSSYLAHKHYSCMIRDLPVFEPSHLDIVHLGFGIYVGFLHHHFLFRVL